MAGRGETGNDDELVMMANSMLKQLHVNHRVKKLSEIRSNVFVTLFEGLCGDNLLDIIKEPKTEEDEAHNCQAVIDAVSMDILNVSLSHITGEDVVKADRRTIADLLDVFAGLLEYIMDRIASDVSSDNDSERGVGDFEDDPDLVTPEVIDSVLDRELSRGYTGSDLGRSKAGHISPNTTADLIALGEQKSRSEYLSPGDTTADLIKLGEQHSARSKNGTNRHHPDTTADLIALGDQSCISGISVGNNTADLIALGDTPAKPELHGVGVSRQSGYLKRHIAHQPSVSDTSDNATFEIDPSLSWDARQKTAGRDQLAQTTRHTIGDRDLFDSQRRNLLRHTAPSALTGIDPLSTGSDRWTRPSSARNGGVSVATVSPTRSAAFPVSSGAHTFEPLPVYTGGDSDTSPHNGPYSSAVNSQVTSVPTNTAGLPSQTVTHHLYHHFNTAPPPAPGSDISSILSASLPVPAATSVGAYNTVGGTFHESLLPPSHQRSRGSRMNDLVDFRSRMDYGRFDPLSRHHAQEDDIDKELSQALRNALRDVSSETEEIHRLSTRDADKSGHESSGILRHTLTDSAIQTDNLPMGNGVDDRREQTKRKVSFLNERMSDASSSSSTRNESYSGKKVSEKDKSVPTRRKQHNVRTSPNRDKVQSRSQKKREKSPPRAESRLAASDTYATTFREYLDKYYGTVDKRDQLEEREQGEADDEDEVLSQHSDGVIDYGDPLRKRLEEEEDADISSNDHEMLQTLKQRLQRPKSVRFDDILDDAAPGHMDGLRYKLSREERKARAKAGILERMYEYELGDYEEEVREALKELNYKARDKEVEFKKKVLKKPKTCRYKPDKKYTVPPVSRPQSRMTRPQSAAFRPRKRSASASPYRGRRHQSPPINGEGDLLTSLLSEFPFLHLSKQTLHDLWRKSSNQLKALTQAEQEVRRKKSKAQVQVEEAERRQQVLLNIMKKELSHNQRMKDLKERRQAQQTVKSGIRDRRLQHVRSQKYYDEFQVRMRSKMMKKKTKEELLFKKLFEDGLQIQKERMRDVRKYAKEQRQHRTDKQQDELASLENYYRDQFSMLSESLALERMNIEVREKAQSQVLTKMKKELRRKMEHEIQDFQEQLYRDDDEEYWRQLDADRLKHKLEMAKYQVKI